MRNVHTAETYNEVMALNGTMSTRRASKATGISAWTIGKWWRGEAQPATMYQANRRQKFEDYFRNRGEWHPVYNPDPWLVPFEKLYLHGPTLLAYIELRVGLESAREMLPTHGGSYRRLTEMVDRKLWLRFDAADELFVQLGLVLSELDCEPIVCASPMSLPKEVPVAA